MGSTISHRSSLFRYSGALVLIYWCVGVGVRAEYEQCSTFCSPYKDCAEWCDDGYWTTTCGQYNFGESNGMCGGYYYGYCGDGYCNPFNGENCAWCSDCSPACYTAAPNVRYPNDGIGWNSVTQPNEDLIDGQCFGNCGKGCSEHPNPCSSSFGIPDQYWELTFSQGPDYGSNYYEWCDENDQTRYRQYWNGYTGLGRWSYHGYYTLGCKYHDTTCAFGGWFPGCWWSPGSVLCDIDAEARVWSYELWLQKIIEYVGDAEAIGPC